MRTGLKRNETGVIRCGGGRGREKGTELVLPSFSGRVARLRFSKHHEKKAIKIASVSRLAAATVLINIYINLHDAVAGFVM